MHNELYHHGVKGMKWGVRRYRNKDGSLTDKGVEKYAKKGYSQDSYNRNKTAGGKLWDKWTSNHKLRGNVKYDNSTKKQNRDRAEQYVAEKYGGKKKTTKKKTTKTKAVKGAATTAKILNKVGKAYLTDQLFFNGQGTKMAKKAVKNIGRAGYTAYEMSRGGYDIRWYDN